MEEADGKKPVLVSEIGEIKNKEIKTESADIPPEEIEDDREKENDDETDSGSDTDSNSDSDSDSDSDLEYKCDVCNRKFSGYLPFKQHQKGKKHAKAVLRKKTEKKLLKEGAKGEIIDSDEEVLLQEPYALCKLCDKEFAGPESYQNHLKCKKHKQKILEASILEQVQEEGVVNVEKLKELYKSKQPANDGVGDAKGKISLKPESEVEEKSLDEFECKECEKVFSGLKPFVQHLMSKKHSKYQEKAKLLHKVIPEISKDNKSGGNDLTTLVVEDGILLCRICSTSFTGPESASTHIKSKKHSKMLDKHIRKLERKKAKLESKNSGIDSSKNEQKEHLGSENQDGATKKIEGFIDYEKYKKYKNIMNSLQENQMLQ